MGETDLEKRERGSENGWGKSSKPVASNGDEIVKSEKKTIVTLKLRTAG